MTFSKFYRPWLSLQACKTAIRESIEAEIRREREYRENPEMVCMNVMTIRGFLFVILFASLKVSCILNMCHSIPID